MTFFSELERQLNTTETLNGSMAYNTTKNKLLDFFATAGAMRNRNEEDILESFYAAFDENNLLAIKALFYIRDIREGQGERRVFRTILKDLAENKPNIVMKNLHLIGHFGRYDDLLVLLNTPLKQRVADYIKIQLKKDYESENPSLLAKWLPTVGRMGSPSRKQARRLCKLMNVKEKNYRKVISTLRKRLDVIEVKASSNKWNEIELEKITSSNHIKYRAAFSRHIPEKLNEYLENVRLGKAKINTSTLYPYDIVRKCRKDSSSSEKELLNSLWNNLPDYLNGNNTDLVTVVDVSGSMYDNFRNNVAPIDVAISLGLYIAERNQGAFRNKFITFSNKPSLVEIKGDTLCDKLRFIAGSSWGMSTNLEAVFDLILQTALKARITNKQMPRRLIIISDMQFDSATSNDVTIFENAKNNFEKHGFKLPVVVFWNVNSSNTAFQVYNKYQDVLLVSGCSATIMDQVLNCQNAVKLMLDILNSERYSCIKI